MAQSQTRPMTADDLLAMPPGQGQRYELIEGVIIVTAAAGGKHGLIAGNIFTALALYLNDHPIGRLFAAETGFYTRGDENTVRAPDVAFIRDEKVPPEGIPDGYLHIVPDLVVEVVSPFDRAAEVDEKVQEWLRFGVPDVWVAYPSTRRFMLYRQGESSVAILSADSVLEGGSALPGFTRTVASLFAD